MLSQARSFMSFTVLALLFAGQPPSTAQGPAVQLPGDNGKVGVPYSLGPKGQEFVFTLEKAEFAHRAFFQDNAMWAGENQRVLILWFAVQNPGKADRFFNGLVFKLTVVSPDDKNYVGNGGLYYGDTLQGVNVQIKPAQKIHVFAPILIHPRGVVNKLIVQPQAGPVLRYDLRATTKWVPDAFAGDNGVDILEVGKAKVGVPFGVGWFDFTIEKIEENTAESGGIKPEEGKRLIIATLTVKNVSKFKPAFAENFLPAKMMDENGEEIHYHGMRKMSSDESPAHQNYDPGQQMRCRLVFEAPSAVKPVSLKLTDAASARSVVVGLK